MIHAFHCVQDPKNAKHHEAFGAENLPNLTQNLMETNGKSFIRCRKSIETKVFKPNKFRNTHSELSTKQKSRPQQNLPGEHSVSWNSKISRRRRSTGLDTKNKTAIVVLVNMALKVNTNKVFMKFQNKFLFYNFRATGSTV